MRILFLVLLILFGFSTSLKAQSATDLLNQAVSHFDEQHYLDAQKTITEAIGKAKKEKWDGEDWVVLLIWKSKIETEIDHNQAITDYLYVLDVCSKSLGKEHAYYGIVLTNLAELYENIGENTKAISFYWEALDNAEKSLGKDHPDYGLCLSNLAVLYIGTGDYSKALPLMLEALENTEKSLGKDHPAYGTCLSNLAGLYERMGDFDKALPMYLEALKNTSKILGKDDPAYGICLSNLANLYKSMGEYTKALPLNLEALENTENTLGKDHPYYDIFLNNLANLYKSMGEYAKALPLYLENLEYTENRLGKDHSDYARCLSNLAGLYESMGEYAKALPLNMEALENTEKSLGKNHPQYGSCLSNLAGLYESMGEYTKALPLYLEALENTETNFGKANSEYGLCLNNLALLYVNMGDYSKALTLYLEALKNTEKVLGKDHPDYGTQLSNLAELYRRIGEYTKALPLYLEALENTEKSLGKNHPDYGLRLNNLAVVYQNMGEYVKALPLNMEALEITEKFLGKDHPDYALRLNNLAALYENMGEYSKSLEISQNGIEANKRFLANNLLSLSEENKASLIKKNIFYTDILQSLILQFPDLKPTSAITSWENVSFYKGLSLKSGNLLKQKLQASTDTTIVKMMEQLELYQNLVNKENAKPIDKQSPSLADYQAKAKAAELQLLTKSQDFKQLKEGLSAKYEDLIKHLKLGEAAIEFTNFNFSRKDWTDTTYYAAYIIKPKSTKPEFVVLFTQKELLDIVDMSTSSTTNINTNYLKRGAKLVDTKFSTTNLYDLVWKKLSPYLNDITTIYLSPSGYLSKVSFAAMQDSTGQYLSQKYQLNYKLSLTDLLFEKTNVSPTSFLLAGGINYEYNATKKEAIKDTFDISVAARRGLRGNTWMYLEGTKIETQKIDLLLKTANKKTIYFKEEEATEKNLKLALSQSPSVWHIATHGFYIPLKTTHEEKNTTNENDYKVNEDPMYRSGLIVAGGNYAWKNGGNPYEEEDGIMLAKEISTMNLSNTQLVVLSACETGLGDLNGSEGVMGLQRALKMAGVHYQITTLWQVPDVETVEFMESFYQNWLSGVSLESAFNKAQLNMSKKYATDPSKWGAFVLYQ